MGTLRPAAPVPVPADLPLIPALIEPAAAVDADEEGREGEPESRFSSDLASLTQSFDRHANPSLQVAFAQQPQPSAPVKQVGCVVQLDAKHIHETAASSNARIVDPRS